jgi:hypothetical protein
MKVAYQHYMMALPIHMSPRGSWHAVGSVRHIPVAQGLTDNARHVILQTVDPRFLR